MKYILPNKDLLEKHSEELENKKHYNLSKLIFKKYENDLLTIPLGIDSEKNKYYMDLKEISGILISGETGSGKSIFLNSIIISLLLKNKPTDIEFMFIDPRGVEFNYYDGLPHLKTNILKDNEESLNGLKSIGALLEERREIFANANYRNILEFNKMNANLSQIFVIIDEASTLLELEESKEVIKLILREGYKFGIHIILSTSSYLENIFDEEIIEASTYRLSFDLASAEQADFIKIDGANLLTIEGDALIKCRNGVVHEIQTPYVSDYDIKTVTGFIKSQNK